MNSNYQYEQQQQPQNNYRQQIPQTNSFENMRQMPVDAWRSPVPPIQMSQMPPQMQQMQQMPQMQQMVDASLADILRRPPVGYKPQQLSYAPQCAPQPQYDDQSYRCKYFKNEQLKCLKY